jgi:GntR family transcriptional regulator
VVLDRATERISPVLPSADDARRLAVGAQLPCFAIERLGSRSDQPLEWRFTLIRGDRFAFVAAWEPGDASTSRFELAPSPPC